MRATTEEFMYYLAFVYLSVCKLATLR